MTSSLSKITSQHLDRMAIVYVRQSSLAQVRGNRESTARQYGQAEEARRLGWDPGKILVIDAGKVAERGTHEELLAADGLYAELYHTQFAVQDSVAPLN